MDRSVPQRSDPPGTTSTATAKMLNLVWQTMKNPMRRPIDEATDCEYAMTMAMEGDLR